MTPKLKRTTWRRYKKFPTQTNRHIYEEANKRLKLVIKSAKIKAVNNLTNNISSERTSKENWQHMNKFLSKGGASMKTIKTLITPEGPVCNPAEIAESIANHPSKKSQRSTSHSATSLISGRIDETASTLSPGELSERPSYKQHLDNQITWGEFVEAMSKCADSSPGIDRISCRMVKEAGKVSSKTSDALQLYTQDWNIPTQLEGCTNNTHS